MRKTRRGKQGGRGEKAAAGGGIQGDIAPIPQEREKEMRRTEACSSSSAAQISRSSGSSAGGVVKGEGHC
ncbi:neuronal acetylcholine receptor subunit alpha-5 [Platysternon megacephalum]|uniref:Neuronal acetylcholine receptor subunit alpha-5 n=1 Tax=Platysternon megacephalum TaxID=55544 RepID=A0A4D9E0G7_9SAUR|nr:neuronal acetylcholine receptor subunit alpha-5 [Platysternon megacephalum]